jgi:hypothetical protein
MPTLKEHGKKNPLIIIILKSMFLLYNKWNVRGMAHMHTVSTLADLVLNV